MMTIYLHRFGPLLCAHRSWDEVRRISPLKRRPSTPWQRRRRSFILSAEGENSESISGMLSEKEARIVLGVTETAPFDEIVEAKNRLLRTANLDKDAQQEIQRAYDLLLMRSMTRRVQDCDAIPTDVRFADVQKRDLTKEKFMSKIPTGGVAVEQPQSNAFRANSVVFGILALSIFPQGVNPVTETHDVVPGFQLALAFVWSVYAIRQFKLLGLGRSVGYTFAGLMMGGIIGEAIESVIHLQQHPIGGFHSPATMISEFSLLGIWACATFLA